MSIRNDLLVKIAQAYGVTVHPLKSRNFILNAILIQIGGVATGSTRSQLLIDILLQLGGTLTNAESRNSILRDIVITVGGGTLNGKSRNFLLEQWLLTIESGGGEFTNEFTSEFS